MKTTGARHARILAAIQEFIATHGYPPSVRELGQLLGLSSPSTVAFHLGRMAERGLIVRDPARSRAIRIVSQPEGGAA